MSRPALPTLPRPVRYGLVVAWAGAVLAASLVDPPSGGVPAMGPFGLVGLDKWLHLGAYAGLAALFGYATLARDRQALAVAVLLAAAYGVGVELLQAPLAARTADPVDAAANALGAVLGAAVWWLGTTVFEVGPSAAGTG
jgi:VanZ family protein